MKFNSWEPNKISIDLLFELYNNNSFFDYIISIIIIPVAINSHLENIENHWEPDA